MRRSDNIWPGFVDALATLLLVIIFVLAVFMITHFLLSQALTGRDEALQRLNRQLAEISELLALERRSNEDLRLNVAQLSASLQKSTRERDQLALDLDEAESRRAAAVETVAADRETIEAQLGEIERLKRDIAALTSVRNDLEQQVGELAESLDDSEALATRLREESNALAARLRDESKALEARLADERERTLLAQRDLEDRELRLAELQRLYNENTDSLSREKDLSAEARAQVALLNQQLSAVRQQLVRLNAALEAAEAKDEEQEAVIADLGKRLNVALAQKVEELSRYRSEFFGRLREVLGDRRDIRVVGDRFVFQSEVLFASGSAEIGISGQQQLAHLARTLMEIAKSIPPEISWVLRVDGHTDVIPISTPRFPSNWELSTARAVSVVKFLVDQGIPPARLAAAGFGEFQPLDARADEIGHRRNRRIELKLTER
ncbi:MAG: peptidoglycan -binding protein [Alphaproteobacteria bacterium]|nr:peptidoglycan -binding protein [Alphaproteobacteria bacterium]